MAGVIGKARVFLNRYRMLRMMYADAHLEWTLPGRTLTDRAGKRLGYLEDLRLHQGRVYLRGWAMATRVGIRLGETQVWTTPNERRDDVTRAFGYDGEVGFRASLPQDGGALVIELCTHDGSVVEIRHDLRIARSARRARWRLRRHFLRDTLPLVPTILRGLAARDPDLPRQVKAALRLGPRDGGLVLDPAFLSDGSARDPEAAPAGGITIIMPVYNAFDLLPEALGRVAAHTDLPFRLILVEDASPDDRVRPWLRDWVAAQGSAARIDLVENEANLGFIGSVNRAFDMALSAPSDGPIVLLNSDAMVPDGWASRLVAPLADPSVASATPLSNDAEIFTAPVICAPMPLSPGQPDTMDAALRALIDPAAPEVAAPTGVGFCMAIGRLWLERLGGFDPSFGRGYGEEVDWCRRAVAQGARHVAVPSLFVEHRGGSSFGPEKQVLLRRNGAILSQRYPDFDQSVQGFIRSDPLVTPRLVASLAWCDGLPDAAEVPVYIGHSMGGGAEKFLQDRVARDTASVVLRFGGPLRCRIEVTTPAGRVAANTDDLGLVVRLVGRVARRRIVYSCAVGDPDLADLPGFLNRLASGAPLEILMHDYLPLSPSYTLLDHDGVYRGVPAAGNTDAAHRYRRRTGAVMSLADWRAGWGPLLARADRVTVFSESSARIVAEAYPQAASRILVRPHAILHPVPRLDPPPKGPIVIGALGAIGPQKGAAVLSALSQALQSEAGLSMALIGRIAPGFPLVRGVPVHGTYAIEDLPHLAARYRITHWLIPSVWPETFSYTVHECLATGLPVMAFDLGAQGDAVRAAPNGVLLPWTDANRDPGHSARAIVAAVRGPSAPDPAGTHR